MRRLCPSWILLLLLLCGGAGGGLFAQGTLAILTEPIGASVWRGGREVGTTPCRLDGLPLGETLTLEFRRAGFEVQSANIRLTEEVPLRTLSITLRPLAVPLHVEAAPGTRISARPSEGGTEIALGEVGSTGLLFAEGKLERLRYTVSASAEGFRTATATADLEGASDSPIFLRFNLQAEPVRLVLRSSPTEAKVFWIGREIGQTNGEVTLETSGEVRLEARREGYRTVERVVQTQPGRATTVDFGTLPRQVGQLQVALSFAEGVAASVAPTVWAGARLEIDGAAAAHQQGLLTEVVAGERRVGFKHPEYEVVPEQTVTIADQQTATVSFVLVPKRTVLKLVISPTLATAPRVLVNGNVTPLVDGLLTLPPGQVLQIEVQAEGYSPNRFTQAPLGIGQTVSRQISLQPLPGNLTLRLLPAGLAQAVARLDGQVIRPDQAVAVASGRELVLEITAPGFQPKSERLSPFTPGQSRTITLTLTPETPPAITPEPERLSEEALGFRRYTVQAGDTLTKIAFTHGVAISDLTAANPTADLNRLTVGQKLRIPPAGRIPAPATPTPSVPSIATGGAYTVQAGDTWTRIAQLYGLNTQMLAQWNPTINPLRLQVGQAVYIPSAAEQADTRAALENAQAILLLEGLPLNLTGLVVTVNGVTMAPIGGRLRVPAHTPLQIVISGPGYPRRVFPISPGPATGQLYRLDVRQP